MRRRPAPQLGPRPELAALQAREVKGGNLSSAMGAAGRVLQKPKVRSCARDRNSKLIPPLRHPETSSLTIDLTQSQRPLFEPIE